MAGTLPADELRVYWANWKKSAPERFNVQHSEQAPTSDALLTVKQVAARLSVSREYIYVHARQFPFFRPNKPAAHCVSVRPASIYIEKISIEKEKSHDNEY